MPLDPDIAHRRPVWVALSDLFLDTDVRLYYPFIARTLADSPYSMEELRQILDDEVAPALQTNLLSVAGEWAGFDETWLIDEVTQRLGKSRSMPLLVNKDREWKALSRLVEVLRPL